MLDAGSWSPVPPGGALYHAIRRTAQGVGLSLARPHVIGGDRVPRRGGVLIVSNHASIADPLILVAASPRPITFMAKSELFRRWYARLAARLTGGAFPVRRGQHDVRAIRAALDLLHRGHAVVVFPEGTRQPGGLGEAHVGVSYLATRGRCPILPVAIVGSEHVAGVGSLVHRPPIEVRFGEPFALTADDGDAEALSRRIMERIAALLPLDRRGVYGSSGDIVHAS
ncbi:MAG TPA: lysophospholipid acyltransferase family protein [Chloroflexota bacterium]|nr:lysophospholipid acyltransferase family protein [Chloroflexota bacterium]